MVKFGPISSAPTKGVESIHPTSKQKFGYFGIQYYEKAQSNLWFSSSKLVHANCRTSFQFDTTKHLSYTAGYR